MHKWIFFIVMICSMAAHAQTQPEDVRESCDPKFMDVLNARATMEGKREVEMAQTIIAKPDSVLEYSCFVRDIRAYHAISQRMFSNNDKSNRIFFDPVRSFNPNDSTSHQPTIASAQGPAPREEDPDKSEGIKQESFPPDSSDNPEKYPGETHQMMNIATSPPLTEGGNLPFDSLVAYLNGDATGAEGNFNHTPLGGYSSINFTECDIMYRVWNLMRCDQNFDKDQWFPTFDDLNPYDPRQLPQVCDVPTRPARWDDLRETAFPDFNEDAGLQTNLDRSNAITDFVPYVTTSCATAPYVLTGLMTPEGEDGFCVRPGCTYFPEDKECR